MTDPAVLPSPIDEDRYEATARADLEAWRQRMSAGPSRLDRAARGVQQRINRAIPPAVHSAVTSVIEKITRAILTGSGLTTAKPVADSPLSAREAEVDRRIAAYRAAAAAEGGVAGAGGFVLALAEFPTLLATKVKLLFEIAALYGHDTRQLTERLYILEIFHLAFASPVRRAELALALDGFEARMHPQSLDAVDWRAFQQEYRDYIDLAKMAQMIPVIGAPVGAVVNYRLLDRLGDTAKAAYRRRWFVQQR